MSESIDEELRFKLMRMLSERPQTSQRELAAALGVSLGKTNYCLHALVTRGWVKARNFRNSSNKLSYAYVLTPSGLREKARATVRFLRRKQAEHAALAAEIERLRREIDLARPDSVTPT